MTVALATLVGFVAEGDQWIHWTLLVGALFLIVWGVFRWPPAVPGGVARSGRIALFVGLGLFAVGQFFLGMVEAARAWNWSDAALRSLNNLGGMFGALGTLIGLAGFVLLVSLVIMVRLGWEGGWRMFAIACGVSVCLVVLISAIVSAF